MAKPVVHFELWSKNPQQVSDFYRNVFEWNIQHIPEMDYHLITPDESGGIGGGIMTPKEGPWPGNMAFYIDVEAIEPYHEKITAQGGKILIPLQEVPGVGAFCLFSDPDGRVLGIWKQNK